MVPDELLTLALSRPHDAISGAQRLLATGPSRSAASVAHQAQGVALRQLGDIVAAIRELRLAVRLGEQSGDQQRELDALASLGATLGRAGQGKQGLAFLDRAVAGSTGAFSGRVLIRRADVLLVLGRHEEALEDLHNAVSRLRHADDQVWEARSRNYRGFVHLTLGRTRQADADFTVAERLYAAVGQAFEFAEVRQNRGLVAFARGDLPLALEYLGAAGERFEALGVAWPDLAIDRCGVLLAAGLISEAREEAERAVVQMEKDGGQPTKKAELLFAAATVSLVAADPATARERAEEARRLFSAQRRPWWSARATMVQLEARHQAGERGPRLLRRVVETATRLDQLGAAEAPAAHLLAGRLALAEGRSVTADRQLARAATIRRGAPPLARALSLLSKALRAEARGDVGGMLAACDRGLDVLDEHRLMMGATELRARATAHGGELARLALRDAVRRTDPKRLLVCSERWRATAFAAEPTGTRGDTQLDADLAALREVVRRSERIPLDSSAGTALERDRRRLEQAIRARTLETRGAGSSTRTQFELEQLIAELGETTLVELVEVDDVLFAIVIRQGRIRLHEVGPLPAASFEVERARFRLRWLARGCPPTGPGLDVIGERLADAVLGDAAADLGDGPVVVVPPGRLQALPWQLLPPLADRVVSVAPSSAMWMRAGRLQPPPDQKVALVLGPGLTAGYTEIPRLAERYPAATVLSGGAATADAVLSALDGAWLAHIAAHGTFRSDSPLFSSLQLDDGPLTVYDLERLQRAPYRMVLSSCDSGLAKPVGADELLGLTSSLLPLGAAGILASVVPVSDRAAVPLMTAVHARLAAGSSLAEALAGARTEGGDDPLAVATAASFVVLGV
ncbi:CHAT domain-containing protein [Kribbella sp. CA-293567]|uniref:CHAT domain-containing protein n=1 Tax=Kribbella sp. CA-293567 TaxID=3002436 RepID=UPI0022DD3287|nr:CHAT domain-containing protein [Kribbella sp. CA-293567]WBQ08632.1 CHAT domain-containing protein [Kribbella sp. CA-293567]